MRRLFCVLLLLVCQGCSALGYGERDSDSMSPKYHRVQAGDTLYGIGRQYKVEPRQLAMLNNLREPYRLQVGSRVLVSYRGNTAARARVGSAGPVHATNRTPNKAPAPERRQEDQEDYGDGILAWPVPGARLVSRFGPRGGSFHDGLDLAAPEGTKVRAAHGGTVLYADDELSGYGNLILLRDRRGLTTIYAHNSRLLVEAGDNVTRGQLIAKVGETGHASGPHLHFEVRALDKKGRYVAVDPLPLFSQKPLSPPRYRVNESLRPLLARNAR